ncbi:hypothetical protein QBC35DRAFT_466056 [Podospora australis]|uniref:EthD domain-containing protein n=1 Tax=Podospora australis TaxID=1536484 RepID=A0AAN7AGC5_9PEZI|nr:hypothetical protein QBC35DRAFT_466056 [Podospora australis]
MTSKETPQLIKLEICLYKQKDITSDEFINWVTKEYHLKAAPLMRKHGIVQWAQTITPPHFREPMREAFVLQMGRTNWTVAEYDIVMTYWLRSLNDMAALVQDPEWIELEKEAWRWGNMDIGHVVVGHEIIQLYPDGSMARRENAV